MTDEQTMPKRRGRPPGSKNKPKAGAAVAKPRAIRQKVVAPIATIVPANPSPTIEDIAEIRESLGIVAEVTVVVQFGAGLSKQTDDHEMSWPAGWPLPRQGDAIMVSATQGGRVLSTNFRLDLQKIYILAN